MTTATETATTTPDGWTPNTGIARNIVAYWADHRGETLTLGQLNSIGGGSSITRTLSNVKRLAKHGVVTSFDEAPEAGDWKPSPANEVVLS